MQAMESPAAFESEWARLVSAGDEAALRSLLGQASSFLPNYVVQKCQREVDELTRTRRQTAAPKFGFRSKKKGDGERAAEPRPAEAKAQEAAPAEERVDEEILVQGEGRDLELSRLRRCRVLVEGPCATLHLSDCEETRVSAVVLTSVFLSRCGGMELAVACQQLRVHETRDSTFRLRIAAEPIVEDCRGIRVGPLEPLPADLPASLSVGPNRWRDVKDFNWLHATQPSPNWTALEE